MLDHYQMGPNLVRGFAPSGIGPRDLTVGTTNDALGGSMYWGASLEAQTPLYFLPKEIGIKVAAYVDAGSIWGYKGPTSWNVTGETLQLGLAAPSDLPFLDHQRYAAAAAATFAGACLTTAALAKNLPPRVAALVVARPYDAFVKVARALFPHSLRPSSLGKPDSFAGATI